MVFNDYVNYQSTQANFSESSIGYFSLNAALGANIIYLSNNHSISATAEPFYSLGGSGTSSSIVHHLALPVMARYNLGFLSTHLTDKKWGVTAGAGLTKHWFFSDVNQRGKIQPTISIGVRNKMRSFNLDILDVAKGEKSRESYLSWELVFYYGFNQELDARETLSPPQFSWFAFAWRVYLTKDSFRPKITVGY